MSRMLCFCFLVICACATRELDTHDDFVSFLSAAGERPAIVYFYSKTCGPCRMVSPVFDEVAAAQKGHAFFARVDVRENEDTPEEQDVMSLPTIQFYLGGEMVHQVNKDQQELRDYAEYVVTLANAAVSARFRVDNIVASEANSSESAGAIALPANSCEERRRRLNHVEDVVVIGGGPAGVAAAIYAARAGLCPLIVSPGVTRRTGPTDFPGADGSSDMLEVMRQQALGFSAHFIASSVSTLNSSQSGEHEIHTACGAHLRSRTVIVATGKTTRRMQTPGAEESYGNGLSDCTACDAHRVKGAPCAVIGHGNPAAEDALLLSRVCSSVVVLAEGPELQVSTALKERLRRTAGVTVQLNREVVRFLGQRRRIGGRHVLQLEHVEVRDPRPLAGQHERHLISVAGAFVATGQDPSTSFLHGLVELDPAGFVSVQAGSTATSVPGIFAAGRVASTSAAQVKATDATASSGTMAALDAEHLLSELALLPKQPQCTPSSAARVSSSS